MMTTDISIPEWHDHVTNQPCGWSPDDLRLRVSQEQEFRSIIADYYRSHMICDKHYYVLQANLKPALSKEGALNLCSLFKVRVTADNPCDHYHEDGHYSVRYRVMLVNTRTGESVAHGDGFCSTRESKYAYRWMKAADLSDATDTVTLLKRQTRNGVQYRVPTPDLADHFNTVLKMACKRAIVAAALCLPLVSELFTQDRGEAVTPAPSPQTLAAGHRQQRPVTPPPAQASPPSQITSPVTPQITADQLKQLWGRIKQDGVDFEAFRSYLTTLGLQSSKELTLEQLTQCLSEIDTWHAQAFQSHAAADSDPASLPPATRSQLFEALKTLQLKVTKAELGPERGEPDAEMLINLAEWIPRVTRACENPDTPADQLENYLAEVHQALGELRQKLEMEPA